MKGNNPRTMRRLTARSKLRAAQALLLLRTLPIQSSSSQSTSLLQAVGLSLRDLQKRHIYLYCFAELQETRLLCSEESLSDALGIKFCTTDTGYSKVQVTVSNPKPLVRTWVHDEGALTEAMELSRDVLLTAQITDASIWKTVLSTLLHHGHGRPLLQTLLNLINANLLQSILHDESELRNQLTAYVSRFVEEAAEKLGQIWDVVRLKVKSSMAESATIQTKHATASVSYGKVSDSDCSVSISKQELQRLLAAAEGNSNGGDKTGEKDKNDKEKSAGPTSADINHALSGPGGLSKARRTLLVERCQASVLGWEEPPEELILNLSQAASLWTYFSDGTVYTASKEYQSRIGVACQKILSLLCQTFNLSSSDSSEAGQSRRLTVDEALRQSGLKCMLALIRSSCSSLSDLRKLLHTESAVTSGSVKTIVNFLESLLLTIVKQISTIVTSTLSTSDFADQCLWGLFNVCAASLPKILTLQLLSSVFLRLQEQQGSNAAVDVLTRLLRLATGRWMDSEDCRLASTAVFSWCLQLPNQPVVGGDNANNEGGGCAEEGDCEDKLSLVQAAIFGLQKKDRCHLRLAVDGILDKDMVGQVHKLFSHDV